MKFKDAIKLLRAGKKIRRPAWKEGSYWIMGTDEVIRYEDGNITCQNAHVHLDQIEAEDWEVMGERNGNRMGEFCLSDRKIGNPHFNGEAFKLEDVKEFIKILKNRLFSKTRQGEIVTTYRNVEMEIDKFAGENLT